MAVLVVHTVPIIAGFRTTFAPKRYNSGCRFGLYHFVDYFADNAEGGFI